MSWYNLQVQTNQKLRKIPEKHNETAIVVENKRQKNPFSGNYYDN